jgi:hypothetical protein
MPENKDIEQNFDHDLAKIFNSYLIINKAFRESPAKTKEIAILSKDDNEIENTFSEKDLKGFESNFSGVLSRAKISTKKNSKPRDKPDPAEQKGIYAIVKISPTLKRFLKFFDDEKFKVEEIEETDEDGNSVTRIVTLGSKLEYAKEKGFIMRNSLTKLFHLFFDQQTEKTEGGKLIVTNDFLKYFNDPKESPYYIYMPKTDSKGKKKYTRKNTMEALEKGWISEKGFVRGKKLTTKLSDHPNYIYAPVEEDKYELMRTSDAIDKKYVKEGGKIGFYPATVTTYSSMVESGKISDIEGEPYKRILAQSISAGNFKTFRYLKEEENLDLLNKLKDEDVVENTLKEHALIIDFASNNQ